MASDSRNMLDLIDRMREWCDVPSECIRDMAWALAHDVEAEELLEKVVLRERVAIALEVMRTE